MSYLLVDALAILLVATALFVALIKSPKKSAYMYAVQSLVLVSIFLVLATLAGSSELYTWSVTAFFTKVLLVPAIILYTYKKMGEPDADIAPTVSTPVTIVLVVVELIVCFVAIQGVNIPAAAEVKPALAISLAHFFFGITVLVTQRNILKQMFGYCLMENGSHLTLALLAPTAPKLVEIGIATDAIFAVLIMAVLALRVYTETKSLDTDDLMELKG